MKKRGFFTLGLAFIFILSFSINPAQSVIDEDPAPAAVANTGTILIYTIVESNGEVYYWPYGNIATQVGGSIEFKYIGDKEEFGVVKPFYDIIFRYANGTVNATISNQSSDAVAMTLILGFGTFNPSIIADTNWVANDATAIAMANTDPLAQYSMNGTLDIWESGGVHTYNYTQNITNGDQKTYLEYFMTSGVLLRWNSSFFGYYLQATLNLDYHLIEGNGVVEFWPYGDIQVQTNGKLEFLFTGIADDYGVQQPFFNCTFINSTGQVNESLDIVSKSSIAMTFIHGIGMWSPGLITTNNWNNQNAAALAEANTPETQAFSMNGTLKMASLNGYQIYDYVQNPNNGNQKCLLVFDGATGILVYWKSAFLDYHSEAIFSGFNLNMISAYFEEPPEEEKRDDKNDDGNPFIPGYPILVLLGAITIGLYIATKRRSI